MKKKIRNTAPKLNLMSSLDFRRGEKLVCAIYFLDSGIRSKVWGDSDVPFAAFFCEFDALRSFIMKIK